VFNSHTFNFTSRSSTAQSLRPFNITPKFYSQEDVSRLARLMRLSSPYLVMNFDSMFSVLPPIEVPAMTLDQAVRDADLTGFFRMDAFEFAIRANMRNVQSCHALVGGGPYNPGGNFNYLANPNWACYGLYREGKKPASGLAQPFGGVFKEDVDKLCNLHATVNVCYGYVNGYPSVMMSRIYGDPSLLLTRLVDYLSYTLGLNVYVSDSWASTFSYRKARVEAGASEHAPSSEYQHFFTLPMPTQVLLDRARRKGLVMRYSDITNPFYMATGRMVAEGQRVVPLRTRGRMAGIGTLIDGNALDTFINTNMRRTEGRKVVIQAQKCAACTNHIRHDSYLSENLYVPGHGLFCSEICKEGYRRKNLVKMTLHNKETNSFVPESVVLR
jgi:hypothetical protein